jgi:hypothetical protein
MARSELSIRLVGYQVRTLGQASVVGEVEAVRDRGLRIHKIPGHRARGGSLPAEAIAFVSHETNTIFLVEGIDAASILDAPPPPAAGGERWRKSEQWWADLLGHFGLDDAPGLGSGPFLHRAGR